MKQLFLLLCLPLIVRAADFPALGERLENYDYPYEVSIHRFEAQGEALEMAYMDLRPEQGNGRSVLLLHGKNFSGAYWNDTAELLVDDGFRVVIPDQVGFGKSSKPVDFQYSFHALADATRGLLDDLEIAATDVVGHSMGGMVATRFALMFPDRVDKLVLVNPIGLEDWKRMTPYQTIDQSYEATLGKTPEAVKAYMRKAYFDGQWKEAWNPLLAIQAGWAQGPAKEKMARISALTSDMVFTQPVLYEFDALEVPTLLIIGERDRTAIGRDRAKPEVAETMGRYDRLGQQAAKAIPGSKLVALEGIGHLPQVEAFNEYSQAIQDFLAP